MIYYCLGLYGMFLIMFNCSARFTKTEIKEHKYLKHEYLKAFLIIPTKNKVLLKPFINYMVHLILFIILGLFYATGWIFVREIEIIIYIILPMITFISLYCTGVFTRFYYPLKYYLILLNPRL